MFKNPTTVRPNELEPGDNLCWVIVATVGENEDWSAYALPYDPRQAVPSPDRVAREGDKISQESAEKLFRVCRGLEWRD